MKKYDFSHINLEELRKLPAWQLRPGTRLDTINNDAAGFDPPGHPHYFTQSVYSAKGDHLEYGPKEVLLDPETGQYHIVEDSWEHGVMHGDLYLPEPAETKRFECWEASLYNHYRHCYYNPEETGPNAHIVFLKEKPKLTDKYGRSTRGYQKLLKDYQAWVAEYGHLITDENHYAVKYIQRYYPGYRANNYLIHHSPQKEEGVWWARYASPEDYEVSKELEDEQPEAVYDPFQEHPTVAELMIKYHVEGKVVAVGAEKAPEHDKEFSFHFVGMYRSDFVHSPIGLPYANNTGEVPTEDEILAQYLRESFDAEMSFEEFCSEFGYDMDSRKHEKTYKMMVAAKKKLERLFGPNFEEFRSAE